MDVIIVDDELLAAENLRQSIVSLMPQAKVKSFQDPKEAFVYLSGNTTDIAFLDIKMGTFNGIELAKKCKNLCPQINIIFVTGYMEYAMDALKLHASGYLLKPVRVSDLREELDNLRFPKSRTYEKRIRIQTFGHFEVFKDNVPLKFPRMKCKECLAYLIDRKGARVPYSELSAILWGDKPLERRVQNNTQKVVSDMIKTLKEAESEDIIIRSRTDIAILPERVECDYFEALKGEVSQIAAFLGEYMTNYSWAEITLGGLINSDRKQR